MSLTVKQLKDMIKYCPDDMEVTSEQNSDFVHISNTADRLIISTTLPIGNCNRSGELVFPSVIDGYTAFSPELDEDLAEWEFTPIK